MTLTPREFADKHLGNYKIKNNNIIAEYCPYCEGGSSNEKWTFGMRLDNGAYNCFRANKCNVQGSFYDLCKNFNEDYNFDDDKYSQNNYKRNNTKEKQYKKPEVETNEVSGKVEKYLKKRCFSPETINKCDIKEKNGNVVYEYYQDGELVLVKYKTPDKKKKIWIEEGGKPVLWMMDKCNSEKPLIITEGEYDAMALIESGINNVVSVPFGSENFKWINECWDFLEQFEKIILWTDNDEAGKDMLNECIARLGEWRCYTVSSNYNDANIHLYKEGAESVKKVVENAEPVPLKGVVKLAEVEEFDLSEAEKVTSGFKGVDKYTAGFIMGEISVWTGSNGSGKSTFLGQTLIESVNNGYKVCAFSGELRKAVFRYWIELQMASERYVLKTEENEATRYFLTKEIKQAMRNWYKDKFFLFDSDKSRVDADDVLKVFRDVARRYGVKVFLIDNLIKMNLGQKKDSHWLAQSEFIDKCSVFAHKFNCHLHIVAHPRKTDGEIGKDDVGGSGDITNLADNVYKIKRINDDEKQKRGIDADSILMIMKNRLLGNEDKFMKMYFNEPDKRFSEVDNPVQNDRKYEWEKQYLGEGD